MMIHVGVVLASLAGPDPCTAQGGLSPRLVPQLGHGPGVWAEMEEVLSVASTPDGATVVTGGADDEVVLWEAATGREIGRFHGNRSASPRCAGIFAVAIAPHGRHVAASSGCELELWDLRTNASLDGFPVAVGSIDSLRFSPNGRLLAAFRHEATSPVVRVWEVVQGSEVTQLAMVKPLDLARMESEVFGDAVRSVPPDPRFTVVLVEGEAIIRDLRSGHDLRRLRGSVTGVLNSISQDGRYVVAGDGAGTGYLWDLRTGSVVRRFEGHSGPIRAVVTAPVAEEVLTGSADGTARLWDLHTGRTIGILPFETGVSAVAFSPDGDLVAISGGMEFATIWDVRNGLQKVVLGEERPSPQAWLLGYAAMDPTYPDYWLSSVAFSATGDEVATAGSHAARIWNLETSGQVAVLAYEDPRHTVSFSPTGGYLFAGGEGRSDLWDTRCRKRYSLGLVGRQIVSSAFSPHGRRLAIGNAAHSAIVFDVPADTDPCDGHTGLGREQLTPSTFLLGHDGPVSSVSFSPDGAHVLTGSTDGTGALWNLGAASDRADLVARLISRPDGTWAVVTPAGRFDTNDLERVEGLHWVMPDDPLRALPIEVFMRDYYEPRLLPRLLASEEFPEVRDLTSLNRVQPGVEITAVRPEAGDSTVSVEVAVTSRTRVFERDGVEAIVESGIWDLHLFRDGQLVALEPGRLRPDADDSTAHVTFAGVKLPRREGEERTELSAYAFNADRVKSETDRQSIVLPRDLAPRRGRAYLITLGVNAFSDSTWNLAYAADDAWLLGRALESRLTGSDHFDEVVWIPLVSDHFRDRSTDARKQTVRAVLRLLAGEEVGEDGALRGIPGIDRVREATPEDLVLLSVSSHGYTDRAGVFYIFPQDIGPAANSAAEQRGAVAPELLDHAISSDELSTWFLGVDAGDMIMIVDACHSAAAVEGSGGFKPGPMGSRGLGQLAYNKGMRVLAASQAADVALESPQLRQGLLTYALVQEGLEAGLADRVPADGRITLTEWLEYGVDRVPGLWDEVVTGTFQGRGVTPSEGAEDPLFQQPSLFDFTRRAEDITLGGGP
jgi:WD40 repeat protein